MRNFISIPKTALFPKNVLSRFIAGIAFTLATVGLACAFPIADPWPSNFGNSGNTATSYGEGANSDLSWIGGAAGADNYGAPVVGSNGVIYAFDTNNGNYALEAISPATGAINWSFLLTSSAGTVPAVGMDGTIYISNGASIYALTDSGSSVSQKWVVNVPLSGGATLGSLNIGPNGTIYSVSSDGSLIGVTDGGTSGTIAVQNQFFINALTFAPAIAPDGTVYVAFGNVISARDGTTGAELWEYGADSNVASPITNSNGNLYFVTQNEVTSISAASGSGNWSDPLSEFNGFSNFVAGNIAVAANNTIYVALSGSSNIFSFYSLASVNALSGASNWTYQGGVSFYTQTSVACGGDGTIYFNENELDSLTDNGTSYTINWQRSISNLTGNLGNGSDLAIGGDGTLYTSLGQIVAIGNDITSFKLDSSTAVGGSPATGSIQLGQDAITNGDAVTLSSSSLDVQVPSSVVANASGVVPFTLTTSAVSSLETVILTATCNSQTKEVLLKLVPLSVTQEKFTPVVLGGGANATCKITLNGPAATGGATFNVTTSSADAQTPATVTVPQGDTTLVFTFPTSPVSSEEDIQVGVGSQSATLMLSPVAISYLRLAPTAVQGGQLAAFAAYLNAPAGAGGVSVSVSSSSTYAVVGSSTINVAQGATAGNVAIHTLPVSSQESVTLTATLGSSSMQTTLTLNPAALTGIKLGSSSILGGSGTALAVYLNGAAGASGDVVSLSSSSTDVTVPSSVTVSQGSSAANVQIQSAAVSTQEQVTLSATMGSATLQTTVNLNPPVLSGLKLQATSVTGGSPTTLAIYLNGRTGNGAISVNLSSSSNSATLTSSVVINPGSGSATTVVHTAAVDSQTVVTLTATLGGQTATTTLTINPAVLTSVKLQPTTVKGGNNAKFAVYLNGPAGPSGTTVNFGYTGTSSSMPSSVVIPPGATAANVTITTVPVNFTTTIGVFATQGSQTQSTQLTITP
jgi:hypothetical protein